MTIVRLDRSSVEARIVEGDNCQGRYILAVAPDGLTHKLLWEERSRPWDDYPRDWLTTELPAVHPADSGTASEDAEELIRSVLGLAVWKEASRRHEDDDLGWIELVEELCPEDWAENIRSQAQELAWQWLCGLNGEPSDLDMQAPWGGAGTEEGWETIELVVRFEWAEEEGDGNG